jgi:hypothetical protein
MKNWEKNVWGFYNFEIPTKLEKTVSWFVNEGQYLEGDICEFGVFQGRGILAWAMLCKELGLNKKIIGFDSFSGFPPIYHEKDDLIQFEKLHKSGSITKNHFDDTVRLKEIRELIKQTQISVQNISSSGDFSGSQLELLQRKIELLQLDNINLVVGDFDKEMVASACDSICLALFDCDLYESYRLSLMSTLPFLVENGVCYLDEYYSLKFPGAKIAVDEIVSQYKNLKLELMMREPDGFERWHIVNVGNSI